MSAAQTPFISSTYWTERIGPTAALATLAVMERERSWEKITDTGNAIVGRWKKLADKHGLTMTTAGLPALSSFAFKSKNNQAYRTLISQEMLAKGYLAANLVYTCTEHTPGIVEGYFEALGPIFGLIRECEDGRPRVKGVQNLARDVAGEIDLAPSGAGFNPGKNFLGPVPERTRQHEPPAGRRLLECFHQPDDVLAGLKGAGEQDQVLARRAGWRGRRIHSMMDHPQARTFDAEQAAHLSRGES